MHTQVYVIDKLLTPSIAPPGVWPGPMKSPNCLQIIWAAAAEPSVVLPCDTHHTWSNCMGAPLAHAVHHAASNTLAHTLHALQTATAWLMTG